MGESQHIRMDDTFNHKLMCPDILIWNKDGSIYLKQYNYWQRDLSVYVLKLNDHPLETPNWLKD